jgi:hypothetical protein
LHAVVLQRQSNDGTFTPATSISTFATVGVRNSSTSYSVRFTNGHTVLNGNCSWSATALDSDSQGVRITAIGAQNTTNHQVTVGLTSGMNFGSGDSIHIQGVCAVP